MTTALARLARSLEVESGEGRLFVWGAGTLFLIGWASVSLANVSETLFLKRLGVDRLPAVFLVNSLLLVGTTYLMSRLAARATPRHLLIRTFAGLAVAVVVLWLLVLMQAHVVFVLLVIASKQLEAIALIVFWTVLGGLLHGRQAKRLYAPMIAGGTLGRTLGSFASGSIGGVFGIPALLPVAAIALVIASLWAAGLRTAAPVHVAGMASVRARADEPALARFGALWRESHLFRLLALSAFCAGTLGPMLYFQFAYVANHATQGANGEMRLLDLYATLRGFINVGVLTMQLVGTSRIFRRVGVPLAAALSPLIYLVGFFGVSTRLDLPSGIGAVSGANLQDHAIQEPALKILITLLPERMRAAATSLIEGPVQRIGGALGNVLVMIVLGITTAAWVGFAALPIAGCWFVIAILLWRIYPALLLEAAVAAPLHRLAAEAPPELLDAGTMRELLAALVDPDPRRSRAGCALVIEGPPLPAIATLARAIRDAPSANRSWLVDALHDVLERHPAEDRPVAGAAHDLEQVLTDTALPPLDRARVVEAYAQLVPPLHHDRHGAEVLSALTSDSTPAVRLAAMVRLARGESPAANADLDIAVAGALAGDDAAARHIALEAMRASLLATDRSTDAARWQERLALIFARLDDGRDRARAAEVLAEVAAQDGDRFNADAGRLLAHVHDADPRVRTAILRFIGHTQRERDVGWVIERLAAEDERESAAAAEALRLLGAAATHALLDTVRRGTRATRAAALRVLREVPVDLDGLRVLIAREITRIRRLVLQRNGLQAGPVAHIVLQRLSERIVERLHTTLLLIAAELHEERIANLTRLLTGTPEGRRRAALLEALEALLPFTERAALMPLLEDDGSAAVVFAAAHAFDRTPPEFDDAVRETLADPDRLTRILLVATTDPRLLTRLGAGGDPVRLADLATADVRRRLAQEHRGAHHASRDRELVREILVNKVEIMLHLRAVELFNRLTTRDLNELAAVIREESYASGSTIVREGELGDCMYVLVEGEVRITREATYVAHFKPGEFFGEMALFNGETRFATATAITRVRLLRLERQDLLNLIDEQPGLAIAMCQTLAARVRDLINRIEGRGGTSEGES